MAEVKKPSLTLEAWAEIRTKYEHGENVRELAKRHGIHHTTIHSRAKTHGWGKWGSEAKKALEKAKKKRVEEIADEYENEINRLWIVRKAAIASFRFK